MNKHPSSSNFKSKSRQKEKAKVSAAKLRGEMQPNKSLQMDKGFANLSKSKQKEQKNGKKGRTDNDRPETTSTKPKQQNKQQNDQYGLCMKTDLKHIISKNKAAKTKNSDVVPELLKNIEKNCKALKHIHQKQRLFQEKRSSQHTSKAQKPKKKSIEYIKNEERSKLRQSLQIQMKDKQPIPPKISRFSLEINENQLQKTKIEKKIRQNATRKSAVNKDQQKNFVEIFKLYKKSFEIEDFKIEKSNRNTNYNTNQSRNSSSHHNSHAQSRAGEYNFRGKSREEDKINIDKIEMLIKNQQKKAQNGEIQVDSLISTERANVNQNQENQFIASNSKKTQRQFMNFSVKEQNNLRNSIVQGDGVYLSKHYESNLSKNLENELVLKQAEEFNQQPTSKDKQLIDQKQNISGHSNQEFLEKKFEKSKFYVQPIPKLPKQLKRQQEEPSLQGCEITLIQNNIILQDSELASLQL